MSADDLNRLIDELDLHHRYSLRRTADREERLRRFLRSTPLNMATPTAPNTPPPQNPSQSNTSHTQQQLYMLAQTTRAMPAARFTGFVPVGVPNRRQLMSYDVARWLCDTETRCHVKGITDDVLKIKEAKMAVATDVGDASVVLNVGRMNEIRDYNLFKSKCLKFWRSASERDRYHALSDFLSVDFDPSLGVFAGNLERARTRVLQDLEEDSSFQKGNASFWQAGNRSSEILVSLDDIVNYFSWGVLFKAVPSMYREALRKVDIKYNEDFVDILSSVQSELCKKEKSVNIEMSAHASMKKEYGSNNVRKSYHSQKSQIRCYRCEKIGHISRECRVKIKCSFCNKPGHLVTHCFAAKKQNKSKDKQGSSVSNSNVVDAESLSDMEVST